MFEKFKRSAVANEAQVIQLSDHAEQNAQADVSVDTSAENEKLAEWLELKSTLHESLLDRLNLSIVCPGNHTAHLGRG